MLENSNEEDRNYFTAAYCLLLFYWRELKYTKVSHALNDDVYGYRPPKQKKVAPQN